MEVQKAVYFTIHIYKNLHTIILSTTNPSLSIILKIFLFLMNYSAPNFKFKKKKKNDDMEGDIIYYHIAIQQTEQFNKQSIFIKLNDHYHIYKNHKSKCPYGVEETNKLEILRHKKKLELKANMDFFF